MLFNGPQNESMPMSSNSLNLISHATSSRTVNPWGTFYNLINTKYVRLLFSTDSSTTTASGIRVRVTTFYWSPSSTSLNLDVPCTAFPMPTGMTWNFDFRRLNGSMEFIALKLTKCYSVCPCAGIFCIIRGALGKHWQPSSNKRC